jgi:hypothetical protein
VASVAVSELLLLLLSVFVLSVLLLGRTEAADVPTFVDSSSAIDFVFILSLVLTSAFFVEYECFILLMMLLFVPSEFQIRSVIIAFLVRSDVTIREFPLQNPVVKGLHLVILQNLLKIETLEVAVVLKLLL